jgi:hypothetical protein
MQFFVASSTRQSWGLPEARYEFDSALNPSGGLPLQTERRIWPTSSSRKPLLAYGVSVPGQIELQIRWRSGVITRHAVKRLVQGGWSLKTSAEAVARIHSLAGRSSYTEIAEQLNREGFQTVFGRPFTHQTICYICRRDGVAPGRRQSCSATSALADGSNHVES